MPKADRVLYSCVVDAVPALYHQVMVWAWTAIDLAGIDPDQLVVHAVDGCDDRLRRDLLALGVHWVPVGRFPIGTSMCNKLVQLRSEILGAGTRVVLSDCDLAWCVPLERHLFGDRPRAKVVDFPNPPLELLEPIFREAGFPDAARSTVSFGGAPTYHNNCNGGLYLMSADWLRRLAEPWPRWVRFVHARGGALGQYARHVFQIAFALAMEELGTRVEHLPLEYNVPTHTNLVGALGGRIRALHFHRAFDAAGLLLPTGTAAVDEAIADVNDVIRRRGGEPWWLDEPSIVPDTVVLETVHGRFRTRRRDHVTQQLESFGAHTRNELAM